MKLNLESAKMKAELATQVQYESGYNFLKKIYGFRRGKIHIILGETGAGKSTLIRSILRDFLVCNAGCSVLTWLSEETFDDFEEQIGFHTTLNPAHLERVEVVSEQDMSLKSVHDWFNRLKFHIDEQCSDLVILDNLTTSQFYSALNSNPDQQGKIANDLKKLVADLDIPLVIVMHTKKNKGSKSPLISPEDVKGASQIINIAPYFFSLTRLKTDYGRYSFAKVDKCRGADLPNSLDFFDLRYDNKQRIYHSDVPVSYCDWLELSKGAYL